MRTVIAFAFLAICGAAHGQSFMLKGEIMGEKAQPLQSAAAVLLDPADSTLLYFSITGSNGVFEMRNVKKGNYLLQVSLLGYNTFYNPVSLLSALGEDLGQIALIPKLFNIDEVMISADRIPMRIKRILSNSMQRHSR